MLKILPTHVDKNIFSSDKYLVSFVRNYLDLTFLPAKESIIGTIFIDVDISFIDTIISHFNLEDKGDVDVFDTSGYAVYNLEQSQIGNTQELYEIVRSENENAESGYLLLDNKYVFYREIKGTDWVFIYNISQSDVIHVIYGLQKWNIFFLTVIGCMLFIVALVFSKELARPVRSMITQMQRIESGDLNTKI
ncbi:cache and HAMP domain-containing protein [Candidatus Dojkabacteria bacterium]|nr:cache and HAMP domain-containing protein [Candidatus Dojkabacteria bacterium]